MTERELLKEVGIPASDLGYSYLIFIIKEIRKDLRSDSRQNLVERYAECAKHFNTSLRCVERDCRTSIKKCYDCTNPFVHEVFRRVTITSASFIYTAADYLNEQEEKNEGLR